MNASRNPIVSRSLLRAGALLLVMAGCRNHPPASESASLQRKDTTTASIRPAAAPRADTPRLVQFFTDSTRIGRRGRNRIEILQYKLADSGWLVVRLYKRQREGWTLRSGYTGGYTGLMGLHTRVTDYNHDGCADMSCITSTGARGANELRSLFIYDPRADSLVNIRNAERHPNILYNTELNCIESFAVYGGCMTQFLRIRGDSLAPFASVELYEGLTVATYDAAGDKTILLRDTSEKGSLTRYKNYRPLQERNDDWIEDQSQGY